MKRKKIKGWEPGDKKERREKREMRGIKMREGRKEK